jgi:hypothetical protein
MQMQSSKYAQEYFCIDMNVPEPFRFIHTLGDMCRGTFYLSLKTLLSL